MKFFRTKSDREVEDKVDSVWASRTLRLAMALDMLDGDAWPRPTKGKLSRRVLLKWARRCREVLDRYYVLSHTYIEKYRATQQDVLDAIKKAKQ